MSTLHYCVFQIIVVIMRDKKQFTVSPYTCESCLDRLDISCCVSSVCECEYYVYTILNINAYVIGRQSNFHFHCYDGVQHEATWFSASDCLLSGSGILCNINQKEYLVLATGDSQYAISFLTLLGLLFLLYPLMGHLTDVYLTRYRSLKWSFGFLILAAFMGH